MELIQTKQQQKRSEQQSPTNAYEALKETNIGKRKRQHDPMNTSKKNRTKQHAIYRAH